MSKGDRDARKRVAKEEYQNKVNPGHKQKYQPPLRPRSTVFKSGKRQSRQQDKIDLKKGKYDD